MQETTAPQKIIEMHERDPYMAVREIARRVGTDADTVKDVLAQYLAETGGSMLPQMRRAINDLAALKF